jgi:sugar-phosphatase
MTQPDDAAAGPLPGARRGTRVSCPILFDLDGVLVDSQALIEEVWRKWASHWGLSGDEVIATVHGVVARDVVRMFTPHLDAEAEVKRINKEAQSDDGAGLVALPGALDCVHTAGRGRWAVVTSGDRDTARSRLAAVGLPIPEFLVTADDITNGKPDPEPYLLAADALSVPASRCVVVEDSPAGVTAGKRAGMTVFAVATTHRASSLGEADEVFQSMHAVSRRLRTICS